MRRPRPNSSGKSKVLIGHKPGSDPPLGRISAKFRGQKSYFFECLEIAVSLMTRLEKLEAAVVSFDRKSV